MIIINPNSCKASSLVTPKVTYSGDLSVKLTQMVNCSLILKHVWNKNLKVIYHEYREVYMDEVALGGMWVVPLCIIDVFIRKGVLVRRYGGLTSQQRESEP